MEDMAQDFGWSLEDWDTPLTPEEQAAADRAYFEQLRAEADAEFLMSPYAFDQATRPKGWATP